MLWGLPIVLFLFLQPVFMHSAVKMNVNGTVCVLIFQASTSLNNQLDINRWSSL